MIRCRRQTLIETRLKPVTKKSGMNGIVVWRNFCVAEFRRRHRSTSTLLTTIGRILTTWPPAAKKHRFHWITSDLHFSSFECWWRFWQNCERRISAGDKFSLLKIEKNVCKAKMSGIYILLFLTKWLKAKRRLSYFVFKATSSIGVETIGTFTN